jgi:acetyl-CoA carboxylase carboxyltransferase component
MAELKMGKKRLDSHEFVVLQTKLTQALQGGGIQRIEKQHEKGKLSARERIAELVDSGSFEELDMFRLPETSAFGSEKQSYLGDGVVTGSAKIDGRFVYLYAQDFTVNGGSLSKTHAAKICKVMDMAVKAGVPIIALNDSGGARVQDGIDSLAGYGDIFLRNVMNSGVIPQITAILGPCAGGAVYSPAIQDFVVMTQSNSYMFVTGPKVVKSVIYEDVSSSQLGGANVHGTKSGVAHILSDNDQKALFAIRRILSYLPSNNTKQPPYSPPADKWDRVSPKIGDIVPEDNHKPYDIRDVVNEVVDSGVFFEISEKYAPNIVIGFCRMNGRPVGVVANQPNVKAGVLDIDASVKAARFIRFCDAFNIPLITFVDVPGFMPGTDQEHRGIIRHGAKLLYAYAEATVPKVTVILRKAYGGAYIIMNSRHLRGDVVYAWPSAEIAVMGARGAAEIIFKKDADQSGNPEAYIKEKEKEYENHFSNPYRAAEKGYVDSVIIPGETRPKLIKALEILAEKKDTLPAKKHGCMPL